MEKSLEPHSNKGWATLNSFLISIPNDDAKEILNITHCKDPVSEDHMSFVVDLQEVQQAMARTRLRVWKEVIVWGTIVACVAAAVVVSFLVLR